MTDGEPAEAATTAGVGVLYGPVMAVWFAPALVVFHEFGPLAAMKQSFSGCLRNIPAFLVYGLIGMLLAILASIPAMLGWLVLGPVFTGSLYASYRDIFLKS